MSRNAPRAALQIRNDIFVAHFEDFGLRQDTMPVAHQSFIVAVVPTEFGQIISVMKTRREVF